LTAVERAWRGDEKKFGLVGNAFPYKTSMNIEGSGDLTRVMIREGYSAGSMILLEVWEDGVLDTKVPEFSKNSQWLWDRGYTYVSHFECPDLGNNGYYSDGVTWIRAGHISLLQHNRAHEDFVLEIEDAESWQGVNWEQVREDILGDH